MSYFDHVRCPSCKAGFDPEKILVGLGGQANCPYCNAELKMKDFFGVRAAFSEDDDLDLDLDDLSSNSKERPEWTGEGGWAPDPMKGMAPPPKRYRPPGSPPPGGQQRGGQQRGGQGGQRGRGPEPYGGSTNQRWAGGRGEMVPQNDDENGPGTALEIMKRLKREDD